MMDDSHYIFITDSRDKKRTARSATHKVRGGGKTVKMPSDYMTKKEIEKMNGEVASYQMNRPVSWKEFKSWPDDIQVEYFRNLYEKRKFGFSMIGKIFGVSHFTASKFAEAHHIKARGAGGRTPDGVKEDFERFIRSQYVSEKPVVEIKPVEPEPVMEIKPEPPKDFPKIGIETDSGKNKADASNIAALLAMLVGTGAKLTIEVTL